MSATPGRMQVTTGGDAPDDQSDDSLFAQAIATHMLAGDDDILYDDAIGVLQRRGSEAIRQRALELLDHSSPSGRSVGAAVLRNLDDLAGRPGDPGTVDSLIGLAQREDDPVVIQAVVAALGGLRDPRGIPTVLAHADHPAPWLRGTVATSLAWLLHGRTEEALAEDDPAVVALIELSSDPDSEVRNWATFGIGSQLPVDGPATRAALWARIDDPDEPTAAEALLGLARRHAEGILAVVRAGLEADTVGRLTVEAAGFARSPVLLPALVELADWWDVDEELLATATRACDPEHQAWEVRTIGQLLDAAERLRPGTELAVASDRLRTGLDGPFIRFHAPADRTHLVVDLDALLTAAGSVEAAVDRIATLDRPASS